MKNLVTALCLLLLPVAASAQERIQPKTNGFPALNTPKPVFPGGPKALQQYMQSKLRYPEMAKEYGIEGTVTLRLRLNERGQVTAATVLEGIGYGCDEEALRLASSLPDWEPAMRNGTGVPAVIVWPLTFKLQ